MRPSTLPALSRTSAYWVAALVCGLLMWTSASPIVSYPLYIEEWNVSPASVATVFAVYPVSLLVGLVLFGGLSDYIGRRACLLLGLTCCLAGAVTFAVAPAIEWLYFGRIFMGMGVALCLGAATAALVEFGNEVWSRRAGMVTTVSMAVGLAAPAFVGGVLVEWGPDPLHLTFWVFAGVLIVALCLVSLMPREVEVRPPDRWRPRRVSVPRGKGRIVAVSTLAVVCSYAISVLLQSAGAQVVQDVLGRVGPIVTAWVVGANAAAIVVAALASRRLDAQVLISLGVATSLIGPTMLVLATVFSSVPLLALGSVANGVSYSLLFNGGITFLTAHSRNDQRASMLALMYFVTYVAQGVVAQMIGVVVGLAGMTSALVAAVGVIIALSVALTVALRGLRPAETERV